MGCVVVGIFPDHDGIAKLVDSLKAGGHSIDRLRVISPETPADELIQTGIQFVLSGDAEPSTLATGRGIITGFGGTGVPGLNNDMPRVSAFHDPSREELFAELDIPDGRLPDFGRAIEEGRSVVGYNAGGIIDQVKAMFHSAGANLVEVF